MIWEFRTSGMEIDSAWLRLIFTTNGPFDLSLRSNLYHRLPNGPRHLGSALGARKFKIQIGIPPTKDAKCSAELQRSGAESICDLLCDRIHGSGIVSLPLSRRTLSPTNFVGGIGERRIESEGESYRESLNARFHAAHRCSPFSFFHMHINVGILFVSPAKQ